MRDRFVALDLETTGLDPRRDAIVSLAAIPFVALTPAPGYVTLVDPARPIPGASTAIHGITDAMVRDAPALDGVLHEAQALIGEAVLVGHTVAFDLALLARARRAHRLPRLSHRALDTRRLAAALHPEWRDFTLEHVALRLGVDVAARHTAEGDALTAGRIFVAMLPELESLRLRTVADAAWLERQARAY
jgi:DNA polymerase III epsilon subunit family exonuclease